MTQNLKKRLSQRCEQCGLTPSASQIEKLTQYLALLVHWRQRLNLTGLRDAERMLDILILESFDFLHRDLLPPQARVLDLGTGAGVPGVPLAICAPDLHFTLLDRSQKKVAFLHHTVTQLQLDNCQPRCDTAEALASRLRPTQRFDAVVTRGVGRVAHLLRLTAPLLRPGGYLLLRKPPATPEIQEAAPLLDSAVWAALQELSLPQTGPAPWSLLAVQRRAQ